MRKAILMVFVFALILPATAFAEKVGDITSYTGDVLVRTKGEWNKITKVPHPVFSSDKVVTKRGRAEIKFGDGGFIRMHVDSILSIVRKQETEGLALKEPVTSRVVKVLVGGIWFDVKVKKGQRFKFRTPSMTAAIRGTSGPLRHALDGESSIGFRTGSGDVTGKYEKIGMSEIRPFATRDVYAPVDKLPPSDPKVGNSNIMKSADKAFEEHSKARLAASRAEEESEAAKAAGDQAAKEQTDESKITAAKASVTAAVAKSNAQLQSLKAQIATAEDALLEAKLFGDTEAAEAAEQSIRKSKEAFGKIEEILSDIQELEENSAEADTVLEAMAISTLVQAKSSAVLGNAAVVEASTQLAIAETAGDEAAAQIAERQLSTTEQATLLVEEQVNKVVWLVGQMEGEAEEHAEVLGIAAKAIADASSANAANAEAQADVSVEATAGDTASLEAAEARATELQQLTITVNLAASDVEKALAEGDGATLMNAAVAIYEASKHITGDKEPPVVVEEPSPDDEREPPPTWEPLGTPPS
jgi:hypothetical protein